MIPLKAGHCAGCRQPVWRFAEAQKSLNGMQAGEQVLLWPEPTSVYAVLQLPDGNQARGIAYCLPCAPRAGGEGPEVTINGEPTATTVLDYEDGRTRYTDWFKPAREAHYRAWFRDQLCLEDTEIERLMTLWHRDRAV